MDIYALYSQALEQYTAKNYDAALKILDEIKICAPDYKKTYMLESLIWKDLRKPLREAEILEILLKKLDILLPEERDYASYILIRLGGIAIDAGLHAQGVKSIFLAAKYTERKPETDFSLLLSNAILTANAAENFSVADFKAFYDEYEKYLADIVPYPKKFYSHKKIRVGFLSADFFSHVMIKWGMMLLTKLNKNLFEKYFYSNGKANDYITKYLRSNADYWHDIYDLTDSQVAKLIHDDEIDILFDLSGHTKGNRLRVAAYRPATVQISGIGYMNSTGLDCFDYFLSDIYCAGDESYFTEKVIKLPHSHICYEPSIKIEPANFPPCFKNGFVTFGSFNPFHKMSDSILIAWRKILDAVPESRLILKHASFNKDDRKKFIGERLNNFGFDLTRVEMRPFTKNYLTEYNDVDIALDTFPYTGGVTTCEALYMGVPVVSLYGARHGSRFGLSILKNISIDELAVDSYETYIERAVALAGDWELLKILRKNLRTMMEKSPLMDSANYIREVQDAFIKILNDERNR